MNYGYLRLMSEKRGKEFLPIDIDKLKEFFNNMQLQEPDKAIELAVKKFGYWEGGVRQVYEEWRKEDRELFIKILIKAEH